MRLSDTFTHCSFYRVDNLFSLKIKYHKQATRIKMALYIPTVSTRHIPQTIDILKSYVPTVLDSLCFNDEKLPFSLEVKSTEIGHLFEHVLLEYLCYFKLLTGYTDAEYSGVTSWNWQRDPYGVFHITINTGWEDAEILSQALSQSILLLQHVLSHAMPTPLNLPFEPLSPLFDQTVTKTVV